MTKRTFPPLFLLLILVLATSAIGQSKESLPELVRRVKPNVVAITTYDASGESLMTGSGFFLSPGKVVTNLHVVRGATRAEIKTLDGKGRVFQVSGVWDVDEDGDLVLLAIDMPSERGRSSDLASALPDEGDPIFVIGIVSAVREVPNVGRIIQVTAPISRGNSGSPVFNMHGQVLGVVTIKVTNGQNINLAIASSRVLEMKAEKLRLLSDINAKARTELSESLYRTGLESLWLGNYDSAVGYFENAVNKNPRRAEAWIQVGYCKVKQGKNQEAIKAYQQAIQLKPDNAETHNKLGDAYYYAGRLREAIESYTEAARLRPDCAETYYNLAVAYFESGNLAMAATQARILQRLDTKLYEKYVSETM
jgi:S1-C subfamily serine protease